MPRQPDRDRARAAARLAAEPLVSAAEISREVGPELGNSRGTASPHAVRRWAREGCRGDGGGWCWLDHVEIGREVYTSRPALRRFRAAVCGSVEGQAAG